MNSTFKSILFTVLCFLSFNAFSHSPDQSYLVLRIYQDGIGGRFELTAKDINQALELDLDDKLTLVALNPHLSRIYSYLKDRVRLGADGEQYNIKFTEPTVLSLEEMEDFVRLNFDLENVSKVPKRLDVDYNVLFDKNTIHRGVLVQEYNWKAGIVDNEAMISLIFSPSDTKQQLSLEDRSLWKGFVALVKLGVWHIWIGLDHILFILALILPAVVRRQKSPDGLQLINQWKPVPEFKSAFFYIIKVITFFTLAHSITLALASLGIVELPSRFVESIIALSIALAALHNIIPIFKSREWLIAFLFGLFHGFGFASVLGDKGMSGDYLALSLFGFNIGVEIGQVLIICMIFPFLFLLRKQKVYIPIMKYGSVILILISIYWFIERAFEVDLPLGAYFWKAKAAIFG